MTKYRSFTSFVQSIFYYGKDDSKGLNKSIGRMRSPKGGFIALVMQW